MKQIVSMTAVLIFVACVPLVAIAATPGNPLVRGKTVTFHLVEKQIGFNYIDNPPRQGQNAPPLIGDQFAFTSDLFTKSGARAGSIDATCTVARGGVHPSGPCYGVFRFKGGELVGIASLSFSNPATQIVVVGGTGVYAGVTGSVLSVSKGQNSPISDDTFQLLMKP